MDQPSIDGVNTWFVSKAAKEAGLKVAISGLGGDELLAGYPSFIDVPRWRRRLGPLAFVPGVGALARIVLESFAAGLKRSKPKSLGMLHYASSWGGAYLLRRGLHLPFELSQLLGPETAREGLRRLQPLRMLSEMLEPDPGCDVARVCALESAHYMRTQLLRDSDWAGMAHGLEIRAPLVDARVLESLAPVLGRVVPGIGKGALAKAPLRALPSEIVSRSKTGFGVPTGGWMDKLASSSSIASSEAKGSHSRRWSRIVLTNANISRHEARAV